MTFIVLLMFFFFQPMRAALHEDFHPEVIAEPFLWWAFLFLDEKKIKSFLFCILIAVMGKENFLGIAFMLGFYAFVWKQLRFLGTLVMVGAIAIFVWETKVLIPHLTGTKYFYAGNYHQMLAHPGSGILAKLFSAESAEYFFKMFIPFLFLPLAHFPTLVLTFPVLFQNLLSANGAMRSMNYHYATGLTPFLFIATVFALHFLAEKWVWVKKRILWIGFALLFASVLRSGPSEYYFFWEIHEHRSDHKEMVREKLRQIPPDTTVLSHNAFIPQLCNRKYVYQFNYNTTPTKIDFAKKYQADYVIFDQQYWEPDTAPLTQVLGEFAGMGYVIEYSQSDFYILKKQF